MKPKVLDEKHKQSHTTNIRWYSSVLTLSYLSEVEPVHPGDLTEGAGSVEDHHDAHRTTGPESKQQIGHETTRTIATDQSCSCFCDHPTWSTRHSLVRFARHRQTQPTLVGVLDGLLFETDEPLQSQTPVLRHRGVQILTQEDRNRDCPSMSRRSSNLSFVSWFGWICFKLVQDWKYSANITERTLSGSPLRQTFLSSFSQKQPEHPSLQSHQTQMIKQKCNYAQQQRSWC